MLLTREQILGAQDLKREMVDVPEWGGAVIVREFTSAEQTQFEQMVAKAKGPENLPADVLARAVAWCCIDEEGKRLFTQADIEALGGKCPDAIARIATVIKRLSSLGPKEAEELRKNSESSQSSDSGTD